MSDDKQVEYLQMVIREQSAELAALKKDARLLANKGRPRFLLEYGDEWFAAQRRILRSDEGSMN